MTATDPGIVAQRRSALSLANETRLRRAAIKADLRQGRVTLADVLDRPEPALAKMTVFDLLVAQPNWGKSRAMTVLNRAELSSSKPIGSMNVRQRSVLLDAAVSRRGRR